MKEIILIERSEHDLNEKIIKELEMYSKVDVKISIQKMIIPLFFSVLKIGETRHLIFSDSKRKLYQKIISVIDTQTKTEMAVSIVIENNHSYGAKIKIAKFYS